MFRKAERLVGHLKPVEGPSTEIDKGGGVGGLGRISQPEPASQPAQVPGAGFEMRARAA